MVKKTARTRHPGRWTCRHLSGHVSATPRAKAIGCSTLVITYTNLTVPHSAAIVNRPRPPRPARRVVKKTARRSSPGRWTCRHLSGRFCAKPESEGNWNSELLAVYNLTVPHSAASVNRPFPPRGAMQYADLRGDLVALGHCAFLRCRIAASLASNCPTFPLRRPSCRRRLWLSMRSRLIISS